MNKGQTHVGVVWVLGGLAIWSSAMSLSIFNDHATLAQVVQQTTDIKESIDNKIVPALQLPNYSRTPTTYNYYASSTNPRRE